MPERVVKYRVDEILFDDEKDALEYEQILSDNWVKVVKDMGAKKTTFRNTVCYRLLMGSGVSVYFEKELGIINAHIIANPEEFLTYKIRFTINEFTRSYVTTKLLLHFTSVLAKIIEAEEVCAKTQKILSVMKEG